MKLGLLTGMMVLGGLTVAQAQVSTADSVLNHAGGKRLSVGGYGEAAFSRNFYSDSGNRYSSAKGFRSRSDVSPTYVPAISSCP